MAYEEPRRLKEAWSGRSREELRASAAWPLLEALCAAGVAGEVDEHLGSVDPAQPRGRSATSPWNGDWIMPHKLCLPRSGPSSVLTSVEHTPVSIHILSGGCRARSKTWRS